MFLKKFLLFGLMAAILPAVAEEAADRKTATSLKYVTHELDTRQDKFSAEANKAMEYTNTAGAVEKRAVKSDLGTNTSDTSLPMVGGVNTKLATKQDDIAAINDHTAVTYTGTAGQIGAKGIYQATESYVEQSDNLIDAKTFNAALKKGLDSEFLCSEYKPGTDLCWVWSIHNTEPVNLFDMSLIPTMSYIVHNSDGSITVTTSSTSAGMSSNRTLSQLAQRLQVGKTYKLSINTTGTAKHIYMGNPARVFWNNGTPQTITQDMLNSQVFLYASGVSSTATIYEIQITEEDSAAPFTTLVPSDYTPLEYIKATGTQYIDTGITMSNDVEFSGRMGTTQGNVLGIAEDSHGLVVWQSGGHFDFRYIPMDVSSEYTQTTNIPYVTNKLYNVGFNINKTMFTVDGQSVPKTKDIKTVNYTIRTGKYDITASLTIWNNGNKVRDFVPARQNSDNKVGLYDRVNGVFYPNAATSGNDFTAGPDINNIIYIPQNQ